MTALRGRVWMTDRRPDGPGLAAACLGVLLACWTAWTALDVSGTRFPPLDASPAAWEGEGGTDAQPGPPLASGQPSAQTGAVPTDTSWRQASSRTLDLNGADATGLQALPGIGPTLAQRIVAYREAHGPFRRPEELLQVPGVGAKRYARWEGLIRVTDAP